MEGIRRSIHRIVMRVIVFLLIGAMVNVAVAWGCVYWVDPIGLLQSSRSIDAPNGYWNAQIFSRPGTMLIVSWAQFGEIRDSDLLDLGNPPDGLLPWWCDNAFQSRVEAGLADDELRTLDARGWPMVCMWSERIRWAHFAQPLNDDVYGGIPIDKPIRPAGVIVIAENLRVLPLRLIWPYFILNTLVFAALLWAMLWLSLIAPFKLRRSMRLWQRRCVGCGYPVGTSFRCSECGRRVNPRREEA